VGRKQYPCISDCIPFKGSSPGPCVCCDAPGTHRLTVEVGYMRGDDEVYRICLDHKPGPEDWDEFWRLQLRMDYIRTSFH
jgi:hypothetical protein